MRRSLYVSRRGEHIAKEVRFRKRRANAKIYVISECYWYWGREFKEMTASEKIDGEIKRDARRC